MSAFSNTRSIVSEAIVILGAIIGIYLYISLGSFTLNDLQDNVEEISNLGGRFGANIAYQLFYLFGYSAYVVILIIIYGLYIYSRLFNSVNFSWPSFISCLSGLILLLVSTCGIEALRIYSGVDVLPGKSGGVLGYGIAKTLFDVIGFTGASLLLIGMWLVSLSLYALFSWANVCDHLGEWLGRNFKYTKSVTKVIIKVFTIMADLFTKLVSISPSEKPRSARATIQATSGPDFAEKIEKPVERKNIVEPVLEIEPAKPVEKPKEVVQKIKATSSKDHSPPPVDLLASSMANIHSLSDEDLHELSAKIENKLAEFGVEASVVKILPGPVVTRFEIQPATGVKGAQIINLVRDLSRALSVSSIRVLETIAGKTTMGLEVPNAQRITVTLQDVINSPAYVASKSPLSLALGKDISGEPFVANLSDMPHLLVAGTTGSGKSVQINSMILSLLYKSSPKDVRLILIDPKVVELAPFDDLPHLLAPVITDMNLVPTVLTWCVAEMERRYQLMAKLGVRNLSGLNEVIDKGATDPDTEEELDHIPLLVVVVDELADLMAVAGKKVEQLISRLAQKARAAGIHLILATQRPSVDVITGLIKANVPSRIGFQVSSRIDSRTILDQGGAESLLGKGDMLFLPTGSPELIRIHGAFVSDSEVKKVTDHIRRANPSTEKVEFTVQATQSTLAGITGNDDQEHDPLYDQAVEVVMKSNRSSISLVQRHLRIGYNRAARIIEDMENAGIISPMDSSGNRKVLISSKEE